MKRGSALLALLAVEAFAATERPGARVAFAREIPRPTKPTRRMTDADRERMTAAQAKRDRKNARLARR